jgi:transcriptional regulator with XRE-family HTH domain
LFLKIDNRTFLSIMRIIMVEQNASVIPRVFAPALVRIGREIRARRKALKASATTTADAAGISRVTLYRVECGEATVSMGAYLNAIEALGLKIEVAPQAESVGQNLVMPLQGDFPGTIPLANYPQLRQLAWHIPGVDAITPEDALNLYERNWRHVDQHVMDEDEKTLVRHLVESYGHGAMLV